jgi:uncharacterized protein (DUF2132 family)
MEHLSALSDRAPLIICGNPRSGTRMHANVFNAHPGVLISDEFRAIHRVRDAITPVKKSSLGKRFSEEEVKKREAMIAKFFWVATSTQATLEKLATAELIGNKTPQIEQKYEILEELFAATPPLYIYCLRNAPSVLRSVKNLTDLSWAKDSVEVNLERYLDSVRCFEKMKDAFPDRVRMSSVDHIVGSNSSFFGPLFDFVGVTLDVDTASTIDDMGPQNTMVGILKKIGQADKPKVDLTAEEVQLIDISEEYQAVREKYNLKV